MAGDSTATLAQDLHRWSMEKMNFRTFEQNRASKLPTADDFRLTVQKVKGNLLLDPFLVMEKLLAHARMKNFLISNLHNILKKVQKSSKQNLKGGYKVKYKSDRTFNQQKEELQEKRQSLSQDLTYAMTAVHHVDRDLERIRRDIALTGSSYRSAVLKLNDLNRKRALLNASSQKVQEEIGKVEEFVTRVSQRATNLENLAKKSFEPMVTKAAVTKPNQTTQDSNQGLETPAQTSKILVFLQREVRHCCILIGSFLNRLLQGDFEGDPNLMGKCRDELWQDLEGFLTTYTAGQLLSSICSYTEDSTTFLQDKTAAINIRKDAENLRFKYETGGQLEDISSPPTALQSVRQLLEESQTATFQRFIETEGCKNRTWKLKKRIAESEDLLKSVIRQNHAKNLGALELALTLFETESKVASSKSVLKLLEAITGDLKDHINQSTIEKQILFTKYQKIQDFKRIADSKQNLICVLAKQNMNARSKLETQQKEILHYADKALSGQDIGLQQLSLHLRDSVRIETELFLKLRLPNLVMVTLNRGQRVAVVNMSIYKTQDNVHNSCNETTQRIMQSLKFPAHRSSEYLLSHIVEMMRDKFNITLSLESDKRNKLSDGDSILKIVQHIDELLKEVVERDKMQMDSFLPLLQNRLTNATQALSGCLKVKDITVEWWEQPAQYCIPWSTVDGLNVQQWCDQWTVVATRLRQLSIAK